MDHLSPNAFITILHFVVWPIYRIRRNCSWSNISTMALCKWHLLSHHCHIILDVAFFHVSYSYYSCIIQSCLPLPCIPSGHLSKTLILPDSTAKVDRSKSQTNYRFNDVCSRSIYFTKSHSIPMVMILTITLSGFISNANIPFCLSNILRQLNELLNQ